MFEEWCGICKVKEIHLSDIECLSYEQERGIKCNS